MKQAVRKIVTVPLLVVAAGVILFEEWGLEYFKALLSRFTSLRFIVWLEGHISRLPPSGAMMVFFCSGIPLIPGKIYAGILMSQGHIMLGVSIIALCKVLSTAVSTRLFLLIKPQMMTVRWFVKVHDAFLSIRTRALETLRGLPAWQIARNHLLRLRLWVRMQKPGLLLTRWRAIRRRQRVREEIGE